MPLINAILHELKKNLVDYDKTQVPESQETQDSSAPIQYLKTVNK